MKINKIYISAFGGLKNFTLDLNDGLNVIFGENEDGKSTVCAFIKSMFYGTGKKTQQLSSSLRQKYTPWNSDTMGGRIYFEHGGKNYCLEREFRKSDSTDRIVLTDTDSGITENITDNIGERFFGISAAAFERSLFIGTTGGFTKDTAAAGELGARLSNLAFTGEENISYQKIAKRLLDARNKLISKTGKAGSCTDDIRHLEELEARLLRADEDAKKKAEINDALAKYEADYRALYSKYLELKSLSDSENDLRNRGKLAEYLETKNALDELNLSIKCADGTVLDESFVKKVEFGLGKYEKIASRCQELQSDTQKIEQSIKYSSEHSPEQMRVELEDLNNKVLSLQKQEDKLSESQRLADGELTAATAKKDEAEGKNEAFNPLFIVAALLFVVSGCIFTFILKNAAGIALFVSGAVMSLLPLILKSNGKAAVKKAEDEVSRIKARLNDIKTNKITLKEEINNINARINFLASSINADAAVREQRKADLSEKIQALETEKGKLDAAAKEIFEFYGKFRLTDSLDTVRQSITEVAEKTERQKQLKLQLSYLSRDLGGISYDEAERRLKQSECNTNTNVDFEKVKSDLEEVRAQLEQIRERVTACTTELKTAFKNSEIPQDLRREIEIYREKISSKKAFCDAADTAVSVLEESFNEVRRGYGSEVEALTLQIFSHLTGGRYSNVTVSRELDISVEQSEIFGTRDIGYLSQGTADQAYLSLRLAISRLISKDSPLPVILDDSLSQYDDKRTETALKYLKDFCASGQALLFTCHNSIRETAQKHGITTIYPYV